MKLQARRRSRPLLPHRAGRGVSRAIGLLLHPERPLLAQLVVTRRCNLACGYCNEYDTVSRPVPLPDLLARVDHLAKIGTLVVTVTGGEPLLNPKLDEVIARIASHGMVPTMISNAYAVTPRWIDRLNASKLFMAQISIDNLAPNAISEKSWSLVRDKLELLRDHARFGVTVNAVLGSSDVAETRQLVNEIRSMGFYMTVGLLHDGLGQIDRGLIGDALPAFYDEMSKLCRKSAFHHAGEGWERRMLQRGLVPFKCRAGARYLYIDEFGRVSYCSQRRGDPGTPLLEYGKVELTQAFHEPKGCEAACAVNCARRASSFDNWRPQLAARSPAL
jgi:MoaA/NifB/PqqE/SkfB family radical SAM enzyme